MRKFVIGAILTYVGFVLFLLGFMISTTIDPSTRQHDHDPDSSGYGGCAYGRHDSNHLRPHRSHRPPPMHSISQQTNPTPSHHHTTNPRRKPHPLLPPQSQRTPPHQPSHPHKAAHASIAATTSNQANSSAQAATEHKDELVSSRLGASAPNLALTSSMMPQATHYNKIEDSLEL